MITTIRPKGTVSEEKMLELVDKLKELRMSIAKTTAPDKFQNIARIDNLEQKVLNGRLSVYPRSLYNYVEDAILELRPRRTPLTPEQKMERWLKNGRSVHYIVSNILPKNLKLKNKKFLRGKIFDIDQNMTQSEIETCVFLLCSKKQISKFLSDGSIE